MPSVGIAYAPALLPDELLYSWLGRLAALNTAGAPRQCLELIFGSGTGIPGIDLPTRLLAIQERLGSWLPFGTTEELLDLGTLLPYHRPFLPGDRYAFVHKTILQGDGKGLKTQMGRVANRFGTSSSLRFCAECIAESIDRHGSPYWMRRHQLPGINCCTKHVAKLLQVPQPSLRSDRQRFITPMGLVTVQPQPQRDTRQLKFAELSQSLLFSRLPVMDSQQRSATYRGSALALGFRSRYGRIDHEALAQAIRMHFEDFEGFDHRERLLASTATPLRWIRDLIERPERSVHPICHLLLIDFLFGSIPAFESAVSLQKNIEPADSQSCGLSPVPLQATRSDIDSEAVLFDTSQSCRQIATLLGKSVTTVVAQRRARRILINERRKHLTPNILERVRSELSSGAPAAQIAVRCEVSLSTVYRVRAEHSLPRKSQQVQRLENEMRVRRERWLVAITACRTAGVSSARAAAPADYAWLYRHDRNWLVSTTQPIPRKCSTKPRVDWAQRDSDFCQQVKSHLAMLRNEAPQKQVTFTLLIRPLGEAKIRRNMHLLPMLHALLRRVVESPEAFRIRRVDMAIAALVGRAADIQLWRVKQLSGLRTWSDFLSEYTRNEIERLNAQNPIRTHSVS
jgi:hypothetical protein